VLEARLVALARAGLELGRRLELDAQAHRGLQATLDA